MSNEFRKAVMDVIADTGFIPLDHGVHAFDRSAFFHRTPVSPFRRP
jgi:hypothetical protein